jgi:hypothetical protein
MVESFPKCQHLYFSTSFDDRRIEDYLEEFLPITASIVAIPE